MTDYTKATGSSGTMLIRDTGTTVEFWLKAGSSTFNHQLPYGWTVNGVTDNSNQFDFQTGGSYQKLKGFTVNTSQTVVFRLFDTGTSGLGGPTTFSVAIDRGSVPAAPSTPVVSSVLSTSAFATFTDGANNGLAIDSRRLGYGVSPNVPGTFISSDGSTAITGLTPGTTYYIWAQTHNSKGFSGFSGRATFTTPNVPDAPIPPIVSFISQTSVIAGYGIGLRTTDHNGPITAFQIGYGTDPLTPTNIVFSDGSTEINGLSPGTKYYFWIRAQNSVGFSAWSVPTIAFTIAGARINVGGVWKQAIPYVKVGGVWKLARPWVRSAGVWKETL